MLTKDTGICIRTVDYSETSQIVTFFTRSTGKITVIAKGSKRPRSAFDGPIEVFSFGKIVFTDSSRDKLATLTEFETAPAALALVHLSANIFVYNCCLFAAELLDSLTKDYDPHPFLFDNMLEFLQNTASAGNLPGTLRLLILFQLVLLKEVGLRPVLHACTNCKNNFSESWSQTYFSSFANGLICRDCESSFPDRIALGARAANCLSNFKLIAEADEKTAYEIEKALISHFTALLDRPPKMARYILQS